MARRRESLRAVTDINITPLMDLTFLLLIVFMITAPMLEYGIDVSPPKMNAERLDEDKSLMVTLNAQGLVVFERDVLTIPDFQDRLRLMLTRMPDAAVLIRADENRPYREVIGLMRAVREIGVDNVSLVTQPEQ